MKTQNLLLALALATTAFACGGGDPKKATAVCSKDKPANDDGETCGKCCTSNGSSTHVWMLGKGCACHMD